MVTSDVKSIFLILFSIILVSGCSSTIPSSNYEMDVKDKVFHVHADFKVYINNNAIDFSVPMYQLRDRHVHVENGIGEVIHVHKKGITIGDFLKTLDIEFNKTCIVIPLEGSYCNSGDKKLRFYVNSTENHEFEKYEIKDLDKILISYGEGSIEKQLETITNLPSKQ